MWFRQGVGVVVLLGFAGVAAAQDLRARVQGSVTDASNAIVVGAKIRLRNVNTGVETLRESNQAGQYVFDAVIAGAYSITVEMPGFATFVQENILAETRADITVNAVLKVGAVAETVNVTEAPVSVSFNSSSMQLTLDTKMTNSLPIIHRNPFLLAVANPAVTLQSSTEQSPYHHWAASQIDVGGNTSTKNDVLVDGAPQIVGQKGAYVPPMDAVAEVTIQQNSVDAEFGHSAGGIIGVQMKSGTNQFHGTAYYFGRNPALNALSDRTTRTRNQVRNNVWGGTSGNPIVRNKIFNFFAYEAQNVSEPLPLQGTLPTDLEREGNFSQTLNPRGEVRQIFDPWSTVFDRANNRSSRALFANNTVPASRIDTASRKFMQDIWKPNHPGEGFTRADNYRITFPRKYEYYNLSNRTDWTVNERWTVFGRISRFHTIQSDSNITGSRAEPLAGSARHTTQVQGDAVWTINPTTVFNIRGSYSKITDSYEAERIKIGEKGLEEFWPGNPWYQAYTKELPAVYYPGLSVRGETTATFGRSGFWFQEPKVWNLQSRISKQAGAHYIKAGGEFRQLRTLAARPRPMNFVFVKDHTADTFISPDTRFRGDAWATFLLGVVDNSSSIQNIPMNKPIIDFWGAYVQDDFKLTPDLTLNLGLRWEYETSYRDPEDRLSRYLDLTSPIAEFQGAGAPVIPAQVRALGAPAPVLNGAWVFTDDDHRGTWESQIPLLLPRAGLAYRINDRTAFRAGYARYATPSDLEGRSIDPLGSMPYPGYDQTTNPLSVLEGIPRARLSDPYPARENPLIAPIGKTLGRYTGLGADLTWFNQSWKAGINDRFNVTLQRQIFSQIVIEATYFVNLGHDQSHPVKNLNQVDPRLAYTHKSAVDARVNNPFFNILTPQKFPGQLRNQSTVTVRTLLAPYPQYGPLSLRGLPGRSERYQAFQFQARRPFANGFNFAVGYNYNRARDQFWYDEQDEFDSLLTYQPSNRFRHKLAIVGIYNLPFGKGRKLMSQAHPVAEAILGGWSVSGISQYQGGQFLRFGTLLVNGDPRIDSASNAARFNTAVFERQPAFTRRSNPWQYSGVHGPAFKSVDLSLAKEHPITERVRFELRMEAYNLANNFFGDNPTTDRASGVFGSVVRQRPGFAGRQLQYSGRFIW